MFTITIIHCFSPNQFIQTAWSKPSNCRLRCIALCKIEPFKPSVVNLMHIQSLLLCIGSNKYFLLLVCVSLAEYLLYSGFYDLLLQEKMDIFMRCPLAPIWVTLTSNASSSLHAIACGMTGPLVVLFLYFRFHCCSFCWWPKVICSYFGYCSNLVL